MNAIEIKDLTKTYKDFSLDHLNLVLPSGCIMGLVGENGAGKSTIIKLMLNMIKKETGSIFILGKDSVKDHLSLMEDVGVVLDDVGLPEGLSAKQIEKMMSHLYKNWDTKVYYEYLQRFSIPEDKIYREYSKGMRMKLGIAVAMSHHPKLLILDEATSGLDPVVREKVLEIFNEFTRQEDHSVLISSHIVSDLEKICDYIAFIHNGKLMLCDEKDVILAEYGMLHCNDTQLEELDSNAILGKRGSSYGLEVIVKRDLVPAAFSLNPVTLEDVFVFMMDV